jgi:hypothetical protein
MHRPGERAFECILVRASRSAVFTAHGHRPPAHLTFCAAPFNYFKPNIASGAISGTYWLSLVKVNLETCIS